MPITVNTQTFVPEAATAATVAPCRLKLESGRRFGHNLALAWRCAR